MDPKLVEIVHRMDRRLKDAGVQDLSDLAGTIDKEGTKVSSLPRSAIPGFSVLAHEWGSLKDDAPLKVIDQELQKFVQFSLEALEAQLVEGAELTWEKVIETFNQNMYMKLDDSLSVEKTDRFVVKPSKRFNVGARGRSEQDEDVVRDLERWLRMQLVVDPNIYGAASTRVPVDRVCNIVARTGPICYKHIRLPNTRHGLDFVDVGVIRYPTVYNPYIQVYRIELHAWTSCKAKWVVLEKSQSGVEGRLSVRTYKPHPEMIGEACKIARSRELAKLGLDK